MPHAKFDIYSSLDARVKVGGGGGGVHSQAVRSTRRPIPDRVKNISVKK